MPLEGKPLSFPHGFQNAFALRQKAGAEVGQLDTLTATVKQGRLHLAFKRRHRGGQRLLVTKALFAAAEKSQPFCRQNEISICRTSIAAPLSLAPIIPQSG